MNGKVMKVWTDDETVYVKEKDRSIEFKDIAKALRFKGDHIKAHADPELFYTAANIIDRLEEEAKNLCKFTGMKPYIPEGHYVYRGGGIALVDDRNEDTNNEKEQ